MHESIRLGRIFGIPVGVNWSVLGIAALIAWTLAASALPDMAPGQGATAYWITATVAAVVFFASLLTHEMAHALVARRNGVGVGGITLWLLGGVSKLEGEPSSAGAEFRIAVVGPLTSLGLAVRVLRRRRRGRRGGPLRPGGRHRGLALAHQLRAGRVQPAARLPPRRGAGAARRGVGAQPRSAGRHPGRGPGQPLAGVGPDRPRSVRAPSAGLVVSGLWLVLVGWFLDNAGRAEATMAAEQGVLGAVRARQLMASPPVTVDRSLSVESLVHDFVLSRRHSAFPVVDEAGAPVGLVTLEDVRRLPPERRAQVTVGDIAVPLAAVPVVHPGDLGITVVERMRATGARRALVLDGTGRLVGIISNADVVRALEVGALSPPPPPPPPSDAAHNLPA